MKKVLLAGATGYAGSFLLKELKQQGYFVRVLTRSRKKSALLQLADEVFVGEITQPDTLHDCCEGMACVISAVGITRQQDGLTYIDVDFQGNLNLLYEAQKSGVQKMMYISVAGAEKIPELKIIQAKEKFVAALQQSGLPYCIVRPNGFFSDMKEFFDMAVRGTVWLFGNGKYQINPIHGADLAKAIVAAINTPTQEIRLGGPMIYTHRQIAEIAFRALGKEVRIRTVPLWIKDLILWLMRTFTSSKIYGPIEFLLAAITNDAIEPEYGTHTMEAFFEELAAKDEEQVTST